MRVLHEEGKVSYVKISVAGTSQVLATAVAATRQRLLDMQLMTRVSCTVVVRSGTTVLFKAFPGANGGFVSPFSPLGHTQTTFGKSLRLTLNSAVTCEGYAVVQTVSGKTLPGDA